MSGSVLIYNRACSKSRAALALLAVRGVSPGLRDYLVQPLTADELARLLVLLALPVRELLRGDEPAFAALGLDDPALPEEHLIAALVRHPRLLQRPIFVHGGRALIARPPERVLELL